jgi:hypothetical protein
MQAETICLYLIDRIFAPEATCDSRLHLIYLINDILHNWFDETLFLYFIFIFMFSVFEKATMNFVYS